MKRLVYAALIATPLLFGCSNKKAEQSEQSAPAIAGASTLSPSGIDFGGVSPVSTEIPTDWDQSTMITGGLITTGPDQAAIPVPAKRPSNRRWSFGNPGRTFDLKAFFPTGFSPEKSLTEEQFVRERNARGCKSGNAQGLAAGSVYSMAESTFHQADDVQVSMKWVTSNKLTGVQTGRISYDRTISDFSADLDGAEIMNKNEKCTYVFGFMGGYRRCPFIRGNTTYQAYVNGLKLDQECRSEVRNLGGAGKEADYVKGKFTLPNGRTVGAILAKTKTPRLETCGKKKRDFNDYTVQVVSEKVQSADGGCATLFDLTIYQADDRYSEWAKVVRNAAVKK